MWMTPEQRTWLLAFLGALIGAGLFLMAIAERAEGAPARPVRHAYVMVRDTFETPVVRETPLNLQAVFDDEINAHERYLAYARAAENEGCLDAARVFRACARAESIHARRHVEAIAVTGGSARALLRRVVPGTTEDNLRASIACEAYEVERLYPALLTRANAECRTAAVRSMTGALSAEREHLALLRETLACLAENPKPTAIFVCPYCGKTVTHTAFGRCPNCFTPARAFLALR